METKEYRTIDKSEWDRGPWDDEPDKMQFPDEATGLPCLIVRNSRSGNLCGYVGVAEGHPCFEKECDDAKPVTPTEDSDYIDVHGGLTFAGFCAETEDESKYVCHVPGPGEPHRVWWLGFDCHHGWDFAPGHAKWNRDNGFTDPNETYKAIGYVKSEIAKLARQLASLPSENSGNG